MSSSVGVHGVDVAALEDAVRTAIAGVDDPEYPGVGIDQLGLVEDVQVSPDGAVTVGLVPTFSGCPALGLIADDVRGAVSDVPGVGRVDVVWRTSPVWTPDRISPEARATLRDEFTVVVGLDACPRCGRRALRETSAFGPTRCRSVARCTACGEVVERVRD